MQQEYWVNVYRNPLMKSNHLGALHTDYDYCVKSSKLDDWKPIYRLHVKLKPNPIVKPKVYDVRDKFNWME